MILRIEKARSRSLAGTFVPLLAALLLVLVAAPLAEGYAVAASLLVSLVLIAGSFAVTDSRRLRLVLVMALAVALAARWLGHVQGESHRSLVVLGHALIGVYLALLAAVCLATVMRRPRITRDTVLGALCGYLLIAYVFTFVYAALEDARPGSFTSSAPLPIDDGAKLGHMTSELLYYSFVVLTTVGFGDIVPAARVARSLSMLEMLAGQLYLAAFVARLVGIMARQSTNDER